MSYKVLIIDDDDIVLFLHATILNDCGVATEPLPFNSAISALEHLNQPENLNNQYLVFLDINMPVMNGWGFLEALKTHPPSCNIQVIMVTSSVDVTERENAFSTYFVNDFLIKPLEEQHLITLRTSDRYSAFFSSGEKI